jgi:hypothetical protein
LPKNRLSSPRVIGWKYPTHSTRILLADSAQPGSLPRRGADRIGKLSAGAVLPAAGHGGLFIGPPRSSAWMSSMIRWRSAVGAGDSRQHGAGNRLARRKDHRFHAAHPFGPAHPRRQISVWSFLLWRGVPFYSP